MRVDDLTPWKYNPRKNDHAVDRLARNIEALGFGAPIVARPLPGGGHEVLAGHTRLKAVKQLVATHDASWTVRGCPGPGLVPVRVVEHLTDEEAALLSVADNKLGDLAGWNEKDLADILHSVGEDQRHLSGFDAHELAKLLEPITDEPMPFDEIDESAADDVEYAECPKCGEKFPL